MGIRINNWGKYKFEDLVENIREQVMPTPKDSEKYIGLEHLDSGSLHVKRWGTPIQLKGTKFAMKKGDLLFARRNAYLKRIAIAPHDGLFSAHGMIFRPKEDIISPKFLPFFLLSGSFWERAIKISVGSLSPTINWGALRREEFKLPSISDQELVADLLWSIDDAVEKKSDVAHAIEQVYISCLEQIYMHKNQEIKHKIKDLCNINLKNLSERTDPNYKFKYLDIASIVGPNKIGELKEYYFCDAPSRARRMASKHSLVLSLVRPYFQAFVIIEDDIKDLIASTGTAVLDVKEGVDYKYVFHAFFAKRFNRYCEQRMTGTNYPAITSSDLGDFEMHIPPLKEQRDVGEKLSFLKKVEKEMHLEVEELNKIKMDIINRVFM